MTHKGFTLVEIMIVVAIIALLAAIAIPNLLRSRLSAQEAGAVAALHTILAAEEQYRASNPVYSDLPTLGLDNPPYVDSRLATGTKQGYVFVATPNNTGPRGSGVNFHATAAHANAQGHSYYVDEGGVICRSNAIGAVVPGAHAAAGCPAGYSEIQ
jgi:type IV pilus assembly protein PilA